MGNSAVPSMLIDWSSLKQAPLEDEQFRQICLDLLSSLGLDVETVTSAVDSTLIVRPEGESPILVECWSQLPTSVESLTRNLLKKVELLHAENVLVMTPSHLSASMRRHFDRLSESTNVRISIGCMEREQLERFITCCRKVFSKYFEGKPSLTEELDCTSIRSPDALCSFNPTTPFLQKDTEMKVRVANSGPAPLDLVLTVENQTLHHLRVPTFGRTSLSLSALEIPPTSWGRLKIAPKNAPSSKLHVSHPPEAPRVPIDHIFVDPLGWRDIVRSRLESSQRVYLAGGPGSGKSRLLREVYDPSRPPVWIDLSRDSYEISLVDHLLERLLDLEIATIRLLETDFLIKRLTDIGADQFGAQTLKRYIQSEAETVGATVFARILSELTRSAFSRRTLVIDNVHRLRHLDAELLRALLSSDYAGTIVFTARPHELEEPELIALLEWGVAKGQFQQLVLDELPVARLIDSFLKQASIGTETRKFLSIFSRSPNMQEFMLALKSLAARGILKQEQDGKLRVAETGAAIQLADYRELLDDLLRALETDPREEGSRKLLAAAAVYGSSFDIDFLLEVFGETAVAQLELLSSRELIVPEQGNLYRFDHELTHEIVLGSISAFERRRLHQQVVEYLEHPTRAARGSHHVRLSRHHEALENFASSAKYSLMSADFLLRQRGLVEGQREYERALEMSQKLLEVSDESDATAYILEAQALEGVIDTGTARFGGRDSSVYRRLRQLETLMRLYPKGHEDRDRLLGLVDFYFGRYWNLVGDHEEARRRLTDAVERLSASSAQVDLGRALTRFCTLEKNCGNWDEAICRGEQAVDLFEQLEKYDGLCEALLNLGAVYLESGEAEKTLPLWQQAYETVEGRAGLERTICSSLIDYSYILALVNPENPRVPTVLEGACDLAKRLDMRHAEARARLNLGNWVFFHGEDPEQARSELSRTNELIHSVDTPDDYLSLLYLFSALNLGLLPSEEQAEAEDRIRRVLEDGGRQSVTGDNRLENMAEYLAFRDGEPLATEVSDELAENPYRRGHRFITLY